MGAIKPDHVVPPLHDRQAVRHFSIATAEMNDDGPVAFLLRGDVVKRVGVVLVLNVIAVLVVKADRPEAIYRNVLDLQRVVCLPIILWGDDVEIDCVARRIRAPSRSGTDQVLDRKSVV